LHPGPFHTLQTKLGIIDIYIPAWGEMLIVHQLCFSCNNLYHKLTV
jgi:hypothetical protein